jgi:tetratricopeptide (TPR) repeat protein
VDEVAPLVAQARALGYPPLLARALRADATALSQADRGDEAEPVLREAVHAAVEGRDDVEAAAAWVQLVNALAVPGRADDALTLAEAAEAAVVRVGDAGELRARLETALAVATASKGDIVAARTHAERAVAVFGGDPAREPWWFGRAYGVLARTLLATGEPAAAVSAREQQIAGLERAFGPGADEAERAHEALAAALAAAGEDRRALDELARLEQQRGDVPETVHAERLVAAGLAHEHLGELAEARRAYEEVAGMFDDAMRPLPVTADALDGLVRVLLAGGDVKSAGRHAERSLALRTRLFGEHHQDVAPGLMSMGHVALAAGELMEARVHLLGAVAEVQDHLGRESKRLVEPLVAHVEAELAYNPKYELAQGLDRAVAIDAARTVRLVTETLRTQKRWSPDARARVESWLKAHP